MIIVDSVDDAPYMPPETSGGLFNDQAYSHHGDITAILYLADNFFRAIQLRYGTEWGDRHGKNGTDGNTIHFGPLEYLTGIQGTSYQSMNYLGYKFVKILKTIRKYPTYQQVVIMTLPTKKNSGKENMNKKNLIPLSFFLAEGLSGVSHYYWAKFPVSLSNLVGITPRLLKYA